MALTGTTPTESWNRDMSRSWVSLISANDLDALSTALRRMQPLTLERTLDGVELTAEVRPAHPAWHVAMVVQVKVKRGRLEWVQTFESAEEAKRAIEQSTGPVVGIHEANLVSLPKVCAV